MQPFLPEPQKLPALAPPDQDQLAETDGGNFNLQFENFLDLTPAIPCNQACQNCRKNVQP